MRCIILEDRYTLIRAENFAQHVNTCMGINGRFADNFLDTIYAQLRIDVPWYELYSSAHWSFLNHHPETSSATESERPYFVTRDLSPVASGHARLQARMRACLPADLQGRMHELTPRQMVALRFASDKELPELVRDVLAGKLASQKAIKLAIKDWQGDYLRA